MAPYRKFEEYNISVQDDVKDRYKAIISDLGEDVNREG
ncbi:MAG TPA: GTP cyclohydrolase I FolE, partial [Leeuwenhoekiella sp.]|nr:GTP cyclohydrolase I FolE [Leeuwenhoekiella sp.]